MQPYSWVKIKSLTSEQGVLKLTTLLISKFTFYAGSVRMCWHFFLFSHTRKSSNFLVLVSKKDADAGQTIDKIFLLITFSKNEKSAVEVAWRKMGPKHFFIFFSKYVIFKFHHFLSKVAPLGDVDNSKKKLGQNTFSFFSQNTSFSNFTIFSAKLPL